MREIKFRAWNTSKEVMHSVYELGQDQETLSVDGRGFINVHSESTSLSQFHTHLLPLQYTGLKDKNGKEIYEGDIVTTGEGLGGFPPYDQTKPRLIEFRNGCWCFNAERYDEGDWIRFGFWTASNEGATQLKQIEVIGNIYENKELLKEETSNATIR